MSTSQKLAKRKSGKCQENAQVTMKKGSDQSILMLRSTVGSERSVILQDQQ